MNISNILIIDDDAELRKMLVQVLQREGYGVEEAGTGESGLESLQRRVPDLVLLDLHLPEMGGIEVLERILKVNPDTPVVMITGQGNIETAVNAMKVGAVDFLLKPIEIQKLKWTLRTLLLPVSRQVDIVSQSIVGNSPEMAAVWSQISRYAHPDVSVLLRGESGTGKELFARTIHERSKRCAEPFVALDCATLPDTLVESELFGHEKGAFTGAMERRFGKFELAQGGTIFLDEIGNLPIHFQAKLLRAIEERHVDRLGGAKPIPVDVRIISATSLDLEQAMRKGTFRSDLYYRLAEVSILLPPLRSRHNDLEMLTEHFIQEFNRRFGRSVRGITRDASKILLEYRWPGNVRELKNAIKSSLLGADDMIGVEHLPEYLRHPAGAAAAAAGEERSLRQRIQCRVKEGLQNGSLDLKEMVAEYTDEIEREVLTEVLACGRFTQDEICNLLDINPKTLRTKLQKFALNPRDSRPNFF
jgi:DNA-binding NtrC family response regulator